MFYLRHAGDEANDPRQFPYATLEEAVAQGQSDMRSPAHRVEGIFDDEGGVVLPAGELARVSTVRNAPDGSAAVVRKKKS